MAAKSILRLVAGKIRSVQATVASLGAANDGDIVALDSTGKLDPSVLPTGVGPDIATLEATEDLAAGDYVNVWDDGGVQKVRLADNSNLRDAHGWVQAAFLTGANAQVFFEGANENFAGLTPGARIYLGTAGDIITTPLAPIVDTGSIHQFLGIAISPTAVNTDIDDCIAL